MMHSRRSVSLLVASLTLSGVFTAQESRAGLLPLEQVAVQSVPAPDLARVLAEDEASRDEDVAPRFAIPHTVDITPSTHGTWENLGPDLLVWRLRVQAPGAVSLNLGFGEYTMSPTGELYLYSADGTHVVRPFSAADNESHGELWTPVVLTDDLIVELVLPANELDALQLTLSQIGYGYRGFGSDSGSGSAAKSGSCNVDVICPEGDDWRIDIPSVGVISLGGGTFCTGFLVNNVRQDQTPYFMTANHCGVRAGNAASLVVYWNYENSTCRTPGSAASGQSGNGTLNQFNTGSLFRSNYSPSDFTLVELDDDPDPAFLVSFAGWDNRGLNASEAIAIHHPNTDEKRISFEYDPTTITSYLGNSVPGNGTHVRVIDWDLGTTEPGSSGSPLFDQDHRVIGQLHGGFASCTSQTSDWYGSMEVSWTGGGTSSTRLSNWLDPDGTGATVLDTIPAGGVRGSTKRYGTEIGGSNVGRLSSTSIPTIGNSITLDATTFPNTSLLTLILSASPASTPFKGGTLLVDLSQVYTQRTLPVSGGSGSITLAIPDDASLVGLTAYAQVGGPDATQPGGVALSNGLSIFVGDV